MLHVWKLQNSEDFRYFVRTARKTPVNGSLISLYLVAEKKNYILVIYYMFVGVKDAHPPNLHPPSLPPPLPWRARFK